MTNLALLALRVSLGAVGLVFVVALRWLFRRSQVDEARRSAREYRP